MSESSRQGNLDDRGHAQLWREILRLDVIPVTTCGFSGNGTATCCLQVTGSRPLGRGLPLFVVADEDYYVDIG